MTSFAHNSGMYRPVPDKSVDIRKVLPPKILLLGVNDNGFYFEETEDFNLTGKIYGDVESIAGRMMNTYKSRPNNTGVLLTGDKGCGKTLLAKFLAGKCISEGMPCIIVNKPFAGDPFNQLMQSITQPCMILMDEFEKVYPAEAQEAILTLLDGVFPTKKMFVFTCNDRFKVNSHMNNRPGRIFYSIEYKGLGSQFIKEYCDDNLKDKTQTDSILRISTMFLSFNFDILKALIEEMNRYGETAAQALVMLNAKPDMTHSTHYTVRAYLEDGTSVHCYPSRIAGNPLQVAGNLQLTLSVPKEIVVEDKSTVPAKKGVLETLVDESSLHEEGSDEGEDDDKYVEVELDFSPENLVKVDPNKGVYTFEKDGFHVTYSQVILETSDPYRYL